MKSTIAIITVLILAAALLGGCTQQTQQPTAQATDQSAGIPNPIVEVDGSAAFEQQLGISLEAPENAMDAAYSIINKALAQINFTLDSAEFTYRASNTTDDISGIYGDFDKEVTTQDIDGVSESTQITIKTMTDESFILAIWFVGETQYSLSADKTVGADAFKDLAVSLAKNTCA